jgi:sigma-B regulation protein RsbU (phosphoserine phosphatase)
MRIYVVDDEPATSKLIASALTGAGHEVTTFPDGQAAWEAYQEAPVTLVVTDWMMPRMNGVELCRKIRAEQGVPYTNVIIVTSLSLSEHTADAFSAGTDDIIGKPLDPETLLQRVAATERGQLAQVEHELRKRLEISQELLGPEHAGLLESLQQLADVSRRQRSYVRCRAFIRRELRIALSSFGPEDARTKKLEAELEELNLLEDRL